MEKMKKISFLFGLILLMMGGSFRVQAALTTTASGLKYEDVKVGTGVEAIAGKNVKVNYTGWLDNKGVHGKKFDSTLEHGEPFDFLLGASHVIKGWDEGVVGMKVGGKRTLMIPPSLAYGASGAGDVIPPNANLIFDIELLDVK